MKEKLEILMADTGLRVGEIATKLGVKAPVISHILSGRNQPNFTLTSKIISTFKEYNPYWWLGTSDVKLAIAPSSTPSAAESQQKSKSQDVPISVETLPSLFDSEDEVVTESRSTQQPNPSSKIERVIVVYSDNSFECFTPRK